MGKQNNPNWRGKVQPKRDRCPGCGKRGLGVTKCELSAAPYKECRYCYRQFHILALQSDAGAKST